MQNAIPKLLDNLKANPKRMFLIDAFGALLTTISLAGILAQLEHYFGMPSQALYVLSGIAFCLFIYSISCHLFIKSNWRPFLRIVIVCNIAYLLISIALIIKHSQELTTLGFIYFILEFIIIGLIVTIEQIIFRSTKK